MSTALPIDAFLDSIVATARARGALVLRAETGAGKTTRVPPALLTAGFGGRVVLVEPRRIAARAAAERIAAEAGSVLGEEVGFRVRFERRESARTRLLAVTDGMMLAWLQADPLLDGVGVIVFDEAHERTLAADLALAMVARVRREVRPELVVVVMSATLEAEPFASFLDAEVLDVAGRSFPVEIEHLARPDTRPIAVRTAAGIRRELELSTGDLLAFLPGRGEIAATARELDGLEGVDLRQLHGDLGLGEQVAAIRRGPRRRVVLATNVAETSLTVEGITAVVDSGLVRRAAHDPARDLPRLDLVGASRAALAQRAGRAGREQPGRCLRLLTVGEVAARPEAEAPEVRRLDPTSAVLELYRWGERDPVAFPWLEAPPSGALERALATLRQLGAIDASGLTRRGELLARVPLSPRLARVALECWSAGYGREAAEVAALLEERDLAPEGLGSGSRSDLLDRLELLRRAGRGRAEPRVGRVLTVARELERRFEAALGPSPALPEAGLEEVLGRALIAAWPERLARRRAPRSYQLASGRGARLADSCGVGDAELLVAIDLVDRGAEASIRLAATIDQEWLDSEIVEETVALLDPDSGRVVGRRVRRVGGAAGLVLEQVEVPVEAQRAAEVLAEAAATRLDELAPWGESGLGVLRARLAAVAAVRPELDLPELETLLREALPLLAVGCRSLEQLRRAPWLEVALGSLSHEQRRALDRDAPLHLDLTNGRRVRIEWFVGAPPVLATRIQDLFGLRETPRLADGRIRLLLHLLAPNGRPQQVTGDLTSFWRETYPQVRRELRGRYPKHPWPEDPTTASPPERRGPRRP